MYSNETGILNHSMISCMQYIHEIFQIPQIDQFVLLFMLNHKSEHCMTNWPVYSVSTK